MLQEKIDQDLTSAMKEKDEIKVSVLRMLKSALKNKEIENKNQLTETDVISIIQSQIKSRTDSIDLYKKGNRPELAEKEEKEIETLKIYLPQQLSETELKEIVREKIKKTNAKSIQDIGKVIGQVMAEVKSQADGSTVSKIVKEELSK